MIRVVVDDLAFLSVDAIVRPATDQLEPVTPSISRLDHQAGPRFVRERQPQSPLDPGSAVVTGAGDLTAPFVIHAVIQSATTPATADVVRLALRSAWQRAAGWELRTVAAPLVGTGPGQLTVEQAATLLEETYRQHRAGASFPAELSIVVEQEPDRAIVSAILGRASS